MTSLTPPVHQSPFLGPRGIPQATHTLSPWQKVFLILAGAGLCSAFFLGPWQNVIFYINLTFSVIFLIGSIYRLYLVDLSLRVRHSAYADTHAQDPPQWPTYTIQIPLYREARAIIPLSRALNQLDYPKDRLTIQLLIEEDDHETMQAAQQANLPEHFKIIPIPYSQPRTKPKACNVGLAQANSDYLVIYDAEDRPEPDQLKKAVRAFSKLPPAVACIQAKLNFYNARHNLITRLFAAEYAVWFDLCLPALAFLDAPIPLGGTSNHFRLDILKQVKGWDEFNVTEDCDLGLRLYQMGYRTQILPSTTWEEATSELPIWIRQRSRWVKGYVQTYLVHMRHPFRLLTRLGIKNFLHFQLLIGSAILGQLLNPIYWTLVTIWLLAIFGGAAWMPALTQFQHQLSQFYPLPVFLMAATCLFIGNFCLLYSCALACCIRTFFDLAKYTILMPFYWFIMGIAAWKGTLQLIHRPHFWEKTEHHRTGTS
ncbi:MAG: glycosyltransferase [Lentisphaerae bacterium]|nr:MAG: glycosyltransferase [Lentisphaerota bacterium]